MKINEITRAGKLISAKGSRKPNTAIFYRTMDFENIFLQEDPGEFIYFTIDENTYLTALVATTKNNELVRFENISGEKGLVTIIILSILQKEKELRIRPTEGLTYEGLSWLIKTNRFQNYLSITDYSHQPVSRNDLENDWSNGTERIGIIITPKKKLTETIERYDREHQRFNDNKDTLIMPVLKWIGDKDLL